MLLRVRVTLPDRPGALGQIARTLGVAGADIVQVVVLERLGGRAVDDFTVVWPGASRVERLLAGLAAIPGVQVDGVWRAIGAPVSGGHDAELLAQVAANPQDGLVSSDEPRLPLPTGSEPSVAYASWRAPAPLHLPEVTPLRARPMIGPDGTRYAVAPFGRAGLVLVVARADEAELPAAAFHITEVDRIAQLVRAAAVILGDRLDRTDVPSGAGAVIEPS
jgi:hypothetical protein